MRYIHSTLGCLFTVLLLTVSQSVAFGLGTPAGTVIPANCRTAFLAGSSNLTAMASVSCTVAQTAGVAVQAASAPSSVLAGQTYYTLLTTANTGNATDTIALSASSAHGWAVKFVRDDNSDGVHQATEVTSIAATGALSADASCRCFVCVAVPTSATAGDTVTIAASSRAVPSVSVSTATVYPLSTAHTVGFSQVPALNPTAVASGGTTYCAAAATDSLGHQVTYSWSDGGAGGVFAPSATVQNPTYTAPANSSGADVTVNLTCNAVCAQDLGTHASASAALAVHPTPPPVVDAIPGDFSDDGVVNASDTALFNGEWKRWHQTTMPAFSAAIDAIYDLAPRNSGVWPNWTAVGDKKINIQDATAFTECLTKSKSAALAYNTSVQTYRTTSMLFVTVLSAPYGIYQATVALPSGVTFRPLVDANGNLTRVTRGARAGSIFYSEYDAAARSIRITGTVTGYSPYSVASIYIGW